MNFSLHLSLIYVPPKSSAGALSGASVGLRISNALGTRVAEHSTHGNYGRTLGELSRPSFSPGYSSCVVVSPTIALATPNGGRCFGDEKITSTRISQICGQEIADRCQSAAPPLSVGLNCATCTGRHMRACESFPKKELFSPNFYACLSRPIYDRKTADRMEKLVVAECENNAEGTFSHVSASWKGKLTLCVAPASGNSLIFAASDDNSRRILYRHHVRPKLDHPVRVAIGLIKSLGRPTVRFGMRAAALRSSVERRRKEQTKARTPITRN